jgi:ABC-type microcin C transport system duplicated ATPase subunit YejF
VELLADRVAVGGAHGEVVAATSLRVGPGALAVVAGEPGAGHTAFGLAITGRLRPSAGTLSPGAEVLRARSALVDAPGVSEPEGGLRTADVVAEALVLAGRRGGRREVAAVLDEHGLDAATRFESVPARERIALLAGLARPDLLVIDTPDRHSGDPDTWWPTALHLARQGRAVVVLCGAATARLLPVTPALLGETDQPEPLETVR